MTAATKYEYPVDFSVRDQVSHRFWVRKDPPEAGLRYVDEAWAFTAHVGQGAYGQVRLETRIRGTGSLTKRAVKRIQKSQVSDQQREIEAIVSLVKQSGEDRKHFASFYGWFQDDTSIYIAMEYFPLGDLRKHMLRLTERDARTISRNLLKGVKVIHSRHLAHRDLKPENLLVKAGSPLWDIKITDFGITKKEDSLRTAQRGTPAYMAPEIGNPEGYTDAVDMWAVGCIIYEMLFRQRPFDDPTKREEYCRGHHYKDRLPRGTPQRSGVGQEAVNIVSQLLHPNPDSRPSADRILREDWLCEDEYSAFSIPLHSNAASTNRAQRSSTPSLNSNAGRLDSNPLVSIYSNPGPGGQDQQLALGAATEWIAEGSRLVPSLNCRREVAEERCLRARHLFEKAILHLESISNLNPHDNLGRYRRLTYVSLEITYVTRIEEHEKHLQDAERYNREARRVAVQIGRTPGHEEQAQNAQTKVRLDEAKICARRGRVTLKQCSSSRVVFNQADPKTACDLLVEAFTIYEEQAALYGADGTTAAQFDLRAQALQGCGEVAQMLLAFPDGVHAHIQRGMKQPGTYFEQARKSVRDGLDEPDQTVEVTAALQNTAACVQAIWKRVGSGRNSTTLVER